MANNELEENNRLLREQNELLKRNRLVSEETLDDSRDYANVLRDQAKSISFQISEKRQLLSITSNLSKIAQDAYNTTEEELADLKATSNVLKQQQSLKKSLLGLESLKGKIISEDEELQREINKSIENQIDSSKILYRELERQRIVSEKISNNFGVKTLDSIADLTKAVPGLRKFSSPFQEAAKSARESAAGIELAARSGGKGLTEEKIKQLGLEKQVGKLTGTAAAAKIKGMSSMSRGLIAAKAGFKALGPVVRTALGPIGLIMLAVDAVKMIAELFVAADKNTTQIAKNLGISKSAAEGIRQEFIIIGEESKNVLVNSKSLIDAQGELAQALGAVTVESKDLAENQVFLTKNLGIASDQAAKMQLMFSATGQNVDEVIDSTIEFGNQQAKANGFLISGQEILREMSTISAEVAGYYGFSNEALAKATITARRFGLNLMQTQNISKSLLDFESSISAELEAELLTGRQLNFEKARYLALQGDSAGAAAEILKQAQNLTKEQRKNPILMASMAKATGLSVDELQKAFLLEEKLKMSREDYNDLLERGAKTGQEELVKRLGLQGASRQEIEKTLDAQEAFAGALAKAKDSFTALVDSGVLQDLIDVLTKFTQFVGFFTNSKGRSAARETSRLVQEDRISKDQAKVLAENAQKGSAVDILKYGAFGPLKYIYDRFISNSAANIVEDIDNPGKPVAKPVTTELATGGIVTRPTRALVGEAGSEAVIPLREFYAKMDEMISAVREGKTINLDGRRVNEGLSLATSKFDRR